MPGHGKPSPRRGPTTRGWKWALQPRSRNRSKMEAQSRIEQYAIKPRPANYRSRLTSKPQRPAISQRSALGKRLRDLADGFAERLGGWPALSVTAAAAVREAAEWGALRAGMRRGALRHRLS